ncbi:MAG: hypothetical protein K2O39_07715 [Clostridiales bacterium]|nr:hypothetical protein [Clostridiales bacterium]
METLYKGTKLLGENGNIYRVDSLISTGTGQGDIYKVRNDRKEVFALKLFHTGKPKKIRRQIETLVRRGQACDAFVMPIEIVTVKNRIGYVMEYIGPEFINAAALYNGIEYQGRMVNLTWNEKLAILGQIVEAFVILNNANLGIMDIKFDNIKIDLANLRVKILDTDTIAYSGDNPVVLGTIGFMPPNTMTRKEAPNASNDVYAIAVFIFMTLMGAHPLDGKRRTLPCNENIDTYLFGTHPVYMFHPTDTSNRPIPQDGYGRNQQQVIDKFRRYPDYFKSAMQRAFVDGLYDAAKRPNMREWAEMLERLYNDSYICENCGEEYFFDNRDKACMVCKQELSKPIFVKSDCDKTVPLFNGLTVFSEDIWQTNNHYEVFKVIETKYDGRFGLENLLSEKATLIFPNGETREFGRGEAIPIFMDCEIQIENQKIYFI